VFSQVAEVEGRDALWALFSRVASLATIALAAIAILLEIVAPGLAGLLGGGFEPELQAALSTMIRIIAPAVVFLGLAGVVTGMLYTLKRFTLPAFGAAAFNLGIIVSAPILAGRLDALSLAVGVVFGSMLQLLIQTPGLRGLHLRFSLDLRHPALRRILVLSAIALVWSSQCSGRYRRRPASRLARAASPGWTERRRWSGAARAGGGSHSLAVCTLSRFSAVGDRQDFGRHWAKGCEWC
jgi:peptidoglycan biosynthesis protein MviN/MurJ (putative lipid II flippase)